jgi:hypothetical protein
MYTQLPHRFLFMKPHSRNSNQTRPSSHLSPHPRRRNRTLTPLLFANSAPSSFASRSLHFGPKKPSLLSCTRSSLSSEQCLALLLPVLMVGSPETSLAPMGKGSSKALDYGFSWLSPAHIRTLWCAHLHLLIFAHGPRLPRSATYNLNSPLVCVRV